MPVDLSIIVGTVDRYPVLQTFLKSIYDYASISYELIILDASTNKQKIVDHPNTKVILQDQKIGFAKSYNLGFRNATGQYVVYLNDDCVVTPYWDIEAIRFMDANPWCGLGAIYFSESGRFGPFQIRYWLELIYANFGIMRRELGEQIGWIDEFLHTYGSDNSLTFKTLLAGYGVAGIPRCKIYHNPVMDQNKIENMSRQPEDAKNLLLKYRPLLPQMYEVAKRCPGSKEFVA